MTRAIEIMLSPKKSQNTLTVPGNGNSNSYEVLSNSASTASTRSSSYSPWSHNPELSFYSKRKDEAVRNSHHGSQRNSATSSDNKPRKSKSMGNDSSDKNPNAKSLTQYEKLVQALNYDHRMKWELALGKRVGFYSLKGDLGTGNFSRVKVGHHALTNERVAIKILDKTKMDKKTKRLLSREISSMEKLHHPNIVRLYEVINTQNKLYLAMEYACGGELFSKLSSQGKMIENDAKIIFSQILSAIEHMHQHNIIHRDLKAENVFYSEKKFVKVGDFGFSTTSHGSKEALYTFCGSPPYAAPELFRDSFYYGKYVDIWALGILLYFTVTGTMPFRAETVVKLKKKILNGQFSMPSYVSSDCKHLIRNILKPTPSERLSLTDVRESRWLSSVTAQGSCSFLKLDPTKVIRKDAQLEEAYALYRMERIGITEKHIDELRLRPEASTESPLSSSYSSATSPDSTHQSDAYEAVGNGNAFTSQTSISVSEPPQTLKINFASAITGTYRILLLRAQKKLISSSAEELKKFAAIANHITGRNASLDKVFRPCKDCSEHERESGKESLVDRNGNATANKVGEHTPLSLKSSLVSSDLSSGKSLPSQNTYNRKQKFNNEVKSKFCVIL